MDGHDKLIEVVPVEYRRNLMLFIKLHLTALKEETIFKKITVPSHKITSVILNFQAVLSPNQLAELFNTSSATGLAKFLRIISVILLGNVKLHAYQAEVLLHDAAFPSFSIQSIYRSPSDELCLSSTDSSSTDAESITHPVRWSQSGKDVTHQGSLFQEEFFQEPITSIVDPCLSFRDIKQRDISRITLPEIDLPPLPALDEDQSLGILSEKAVEELFNYMSMFRDPGQIQEVQKPLLEGTLAEAVVEAPVDAPAPIIVPEEVLNVLMPPPLVGEKKRPRRRHGSKIDDPTYKVYLKKPKTSEKELVKDSSLVPELRPQEADPGVIPAIRVEPPEEHDYTMMPELPSYITPALTISVLLQTEPHAEEQRGVPNLLDLAGDRAVSTPIPGVVLMEENLVSISGISVPSSPRIQEVVAEVHQVPSIYQEPSIELLGDIAKPDVRIEPLEVPVAGPDIRIEPVEIPVVEPDIRIQPLEAPFTEPDVTILPLEAPVVPPADFIVPEIERQPSLPIDLNRIDRADDVELISPRVKKNLRLIDRVNYSDFYPKGDEKVKRRRRLLYKQEIEGEEDVPLPHHVVHEAEQKPELHHGIHHVVHEAEQKKELQHGIINVEITEEEMLKVFSQTIITKELEGRALEIVKIDEFDWIKFTDICLEGVTPRNVVSRVFRNLLGLLDKKLIQMKQFEMGKNDTIFFRVL